MSSIVMATALRSSIGRLLATKRNAGQKMLPAILLQCQRNIQSKVIRDMEGIKRPPPFDYVNKNFRIWNALYDRTMSRFDENTKVILII